MNDYAKNSYSLLTNAALQALKESGWETRRAPKQGRANVWIISKAGNEARVSIRTSRDRWFAFQPQNEGATWKTLDDVEYVCVASYDDKNEPSQIFVNLFDAKDVRQAFDQAYKARCEADAVPADDFGMWVALDDHAPEKGEHPTFVGGGLATPDTWLATYPLHEAPVGTVQVEARTEEQTGPSVAEIIARARDEIAMLMGFPSDKISLEISIKP